MCSKWPSCHCPNSPFQDHVNSTAGAQDWKEGSGAPEFHLENGKHQELQRSGLIMKMTSKRDGEGGETLLLPAASACCSPPERRQVSSAQILMLLNKGKYEPPFLDRTLNMKGLLSATSRSCFGPHQLEPCGEVLSNPKYHYTIWVASNLKTLQG